MPFEFQVWQFSYVSNALFYEDPSKAKDTRFVASFRVLLSMRPLELIALAFA